MTPLARWVLLATLFGHAMSVPARTQAYEDAYEDACVALCRAENAAVNEDKVHVIPRRQFVEGRRGREADRLLGLCFERPQRSTICRVLIKSLLEHRRCDCELIKLSKIPQRIYVSYSLLDDLIQDYYEVSKAVELQLLKNEDNVYRLGSMGKLKRKMSKERHVERSMIEGKASKDRASEAIMDNDGRRESSVLGSFESDDSGSINWEAWCMAQCDIGHGGSACECDIIP